MFPYPLGIFLTRILSPTAVLLATASLTIYRAPVALPLSDQNPITSVVVATRLPRRSLILALLSLAALTYLVDGLVFTIYTVINKAWPTRTGIEVNSILGLVSFAGLAALGAWKEVTQSPKFWFATRLKIAIAASLVLDLLMVVASMFVFRDEQDKPHIPERPSPWIPIEASVHFVIPAIRVLLLAPLLFALAFPRVVYTPAQIDDEEVSIAAPVPVSATSLLLPTSSPQTSAGLSPFAHSQSDATKYGTFSSTRSSGLLGHSAPTSRAPTPAPSAKAGEQRPELTPDPSWRELGKRIGNISPYLWPSKSKKLQMLALICILIVVAGRAVNAAVPYILASVVGSLEDGTYDTLWFYLGGYVVLRFLQGSGGLAALRDVLWTPVMQYSDLEMSQLSFDHLLNLSFAFHTRRKTGEVLRILDRGSAINRILELLLFNIVPIFVDIIIALVMFSIKFEWTLTVIIFFVMASYVIISVVLTRWRTKIRRQMNERDVVTRGIHTDVLLNYETVKYFGGEEHEGERYRKAFQDYQVLEYSVVQSLNLLNLAQNLIITVGLLLGSMIVAFRVTEGHSGSRDFVYFITYLAQLYGPLNTLGSTYRSVNQALIDTEKLLALLNEPTDVNDAPGAPDLVIGNGEIEFENVNFSYDGRTTALDNVSFKVPKGSSVALVGESGSGKSTILRLLYRFYDLKDGEGRIMIDGQDIRNVTQASLRRAIGVIPQDSILFNSSISYNIGYGKFGSSSDEIEAAARSAQMHERIMSFPDGYMTKVGERGVRLSGGEKQRVSIARTLLKNPPILLLDEATSALDTSTEKDIQKALQELQVGRSSLAIAHRLSTIATADTILVMREGRIVEQGKHADLIERGGAFAAMHRDQSLTHGSEGTATPDRTSPPELAPETGNTDNEEKSSAAGTEGQPSYAAVVAETASPVVDTNPTAIAFPSSSEEQPAAAEDDKAPVSPPTPAKEEEKPLPFPVSTAEEDQAPLGALSFPTSGDDRSSVASPDLPQDTPASPLQGVTFDDSVHSSRVGSPDPESEPKRKRISSQNFQRLARRISVTTRRQGSTSSILPSLLKRDSQQGKPGITNDNSEGGSLVDSPASSVKGEGKGKNKKSKSKK
ncbi:hypothetical protein BDV98DRAFT_562962 [Pterulicium gracile]|uniref:P-loop containing nucleoside triphosphate hydrolase protein n=1 Tax=Pterulicium gracile TaxID=1884261 RepID=A0A5C3QSL3_9AGAR|nr:hypothetical protein BDV98DRAFT_562962 [Pterula gracilis]